MNEQRRDQALEEASKTENGERKAGRRPRWDRGPSAEESLGQSGDEERDGVRGEALPISPNELEAVLYPPTPREKRQGQKVKPIRLEPETPKPEVRQEAERRGSEEPGREETTGQTDAGESNLQLTTEEQLEDAMGGKNNVETGDAGLRKPSGYESKLDRVERIIDQVEKKLLNGDLKASVGDWIKLLEIQKELARSKARREIQVTWITPDQTDVERVFGPRKRGPEGGLDEA